MWAEIYVAEKLREFDEYRLSRVHVNQLAKARSRSMVAPVILATGRILQRAGAGLEAWGGPVREQEEVRC
jgi:hypothetical protein